MPTNRNANNARESGEYRVWNVELGCGLGVFSTCNLPTRNLPTRNLQRYSHTHPTSSTNTVPCAKNVLMETLSAARGKIRNGSRAMRSTRGNNIGQQAIPQPGSPSRYVSASLLAYTKHVLPDPSLGSSR